MHVTVASRKLEEIIVQRTVVESVRVLKWSTTHRATKNHHPLLHAATNLIGMLASTIQTKESLLPVVSAFVVGNNGKRQQANILMDSGAQISLVRNDVAQRLKLKGKTTLTTVGGQEKVMKTKLFTVPIRSMENNSAFTNRGDFCLRMR